MPRRLRVGFPREYRTLADRGNFALTGIAAGLQYSGESLYDLYATDTTGRGTIPFAVNWPLAPVITSEGTVTTNAQLTEARNTPGLRATVAAGLYNALTLAEDDQEWIIDDNAVLAGLGGSGFSRIRVTGGNVSTTLQVNPLGFEDLMLKNINIRAQSFNLGAGTMMFLRCAVIHCTIYNQRTGFFTPGATANDAGVWGYDLIAAANYVSGGMTVGDSGNEPAFRIQSMQRVVMVDNRARCGFDGQTIKNTFRSHYGTRDLWGRRNLTEYGDGVLWGAGGGTVDKLPNRQMGRHWWYDFDFYSTSKGAFALRNADGWTLAESWPEPIVATGNRAFFTLGSPPGVQWGWNAQSGDSIGTNTTAPYQAPPALSEWLAADGLPPGADH